MRGRRAVALGIGIVLAGSNCKSSPDTFSISGPVQDCSTDIVAKFSPGDTTMSVGATFTEKVSLTTCSGTRAIVDTYTWSSSDATKVTVESNTAVVKAIAVGSATITAVSTFYGGYNGPTITVK